MATQTSDPPPNGEKTSRSARPALIRTELTSMNDPAVRSMTQIVLAFIIGGVVHIFMMCLFLFVTIGTSSGDANKELVPIETQVDDESKTQNLTNDDIGLDPEKQTNFEADRKAEVSIPGPVDAQQAIGIANAPDVPPSTIPPPPGIGGGQGGGIEAAISGAGRDFGLAGGQGGLMAPGGFGGRSGSTREKDLYGGGGSKESEACVAAGLKWLAHHQADDGRWSLDGFDRHGRDFTSNKSMGARCGCNGFGSKGYDIGATAFGLLPFLGAGETHKKSSAKNTVHYNKTVELGLKYLMSKQNKDGYFGDGMYAHGLASIAICEAYALTQDPVLKNSAQRAIKFIEKAQHPGGGWRYSPGESGDTSVVGWQVMALQSGQLAGLNVSKAALDGATKWLNSVQTKDGGGYGYTDRNETPTMTAVALLCREYLRWTPRNPGLRAGIQRLRKVAPPEKPNMPPEKNSIYYFYYATQVMHHFQGEDWDKWNPRMRDYLIFKQDKGTDPKHPHHKGSWSPVGDEHGSQGGRMMMTSLSILTLEVYYRHLPLYKRSAEDIKEAAAK